MAQRKPPARTSLRVVSDTKSCYPDWETVYADNAIWVYRMIVSVSATCPTLRTSPPRCFWPR